MCVCKAHAHSFSYTDCDDKVAVRGPQAQPLVHNFCPNNSDRGGGHVSSFPVGPGRNGYLATKHPHDIGNQAQLTSFRPHCSTVHLFFNVANLAYSPLRPRSEVCRALSFTCRPSPVQLYGITSVA